MKISKLKIIGLLLIPLGIAMFIFGVSNFTKQEPPLSEFASDIAGYSFTLWFPTIIVGIVLLAWKKKKAVN